MPRAVISQVDSGISKLRPDVALAGEMIDFIRRGFGEDAAQGGGVIEIGVVEKEAAAVDFGVVVKVVEAGTVQAAGAADDAVDFVILFQQQLRQVGAVLAGDAGNQGLFWHIFRASSMKSTRMASAEKTPRLWTGANPQHTG